LRADGFIIHAQATIRTDGFFVRAGFCKKLRAARANPVFCMDTNHPYKRRGSSKFKIKKTVYPKIVDCARMASSSVR
jgi:hypothetical protein